MPSQERISVSIKRLSPDASIPEYAYPGDGAMDLSSAEDLQIPPGMRMLVPTGIAVEIPEGFAGLVLPRSGLAMKHGITVLNSPGLIDSGYRGEVKVALLNTDVKEAFNVSKGDRVAQLMVVSYPIVQVEQADILSETVRDLGGFGSSGVGNGR